MNVLAVSILLNVVDSACTSREKTLAYYYPIATIRCRGYIRENYYFSISKTTSVKNDALGGIESNINGDISVRVCRNEWYWFNRQAALLLLPNQLRYPNDERLVELRLKGRRCHLTSGADEQREARLVSFEYTLQTIAQWNLGAFHLGANYEYGLCSKSAYLARTDPYVARKNLPMYLCMRWIEK